MNRRTVLILLVAVTAAGVFTAGFWAGFSVSRASGQVLCTNNPCRITMTRNGSTGLLIEDAPGPKLEDSLLIIDPHGLPELWQNAAGVFEGPRGEMCTTDHRYGASACLGSNGIVGWVQVGGRRLTAADIAVLHQIEQAVTPSRP